MPKRQTKTLEFVAVIAALAHSLALAHFIHWCCDVGIRRRMMCVIVMLIMLHSLDIRSPKSPSLKEKWEHKVWNLVLFDRCITLPQSRKGHSEVQMWSGWLANWPRQHEMCISYWYADAIRAYMMFAGMGCCKKGLVGCERCRLWPLLVGLAIGTFYTWCRSWY